MQANARRLLELAAPRDGEAVLEVAIGTGAQLIELARRNPAGRTVGIELHMACSPRLGKKVAAAGVDRRVEPLRTDALELPFENQSFDLAVNSYMLDRCRATTSRVHCQSSVVLRPGGRIVLSSMTIGERRRHRVWDALYKRGVKPRGGLPRRPRASPQGSRLEDVRRECMAPLGFRTES